jgi:hypothetical protein
MVCRIFAGILYAHFTSVSSGFSFVLHKKLHTFDQPLNFSTAVMSGHPPCIMPKKILSIF